MKKLVLALLVGLFFGSISTALAATDTIQAVFSSFNLKINEEKPTEIQPLTHEGTTYLPVREVADLLGFDVDYLDETRTIVLTSKSEVTNNELVDNEEWITIREIGQKYDVMITGSNIFKITYGNAVFSIDYQKISTELVTFETPYGSLRVYLNDIGYTCFNLDDWEAIYKNMQDSATDKGN